MQTYVDVTPVRSAAPAAAARRRQEAGGNGVTEHCTTEFEFKKAGHVANGSWGSEVQLAKEQERSITALLVRQELHQQQHQQQQQEVHHQHGDTGSEGSEESGIFSTGKAAD